MGRISLALALVGVALHRAMPVLLRWVWRVPRPDTPEELDTRGMRVRIPGVRDKWLAGRFLEPAGGTSEGTVLVMHGWGGHAGAMLPIAPPFTDAGLGILFLDARCHGYSDADDFASMPRFAEDIEAGLRWLEDTRGIDPREVVLVGHSVGAGAALLAATRTRVAGVVAVSCMAHPAELMTALMRRAHLPRALIRYLLWRTEGLIGLRFDDFAPKATIARVDAPVLIVHGALDRTVPLSDAHVLMAAASLKEEVDLLVVEEADHRSDEAFVQAASEIVGFVRSCLSRLRE